MTHLSSAIIILSTTAEGEEERCELPAAALVHLNNLAEAGHYGGSPCKVARHAIMRHYSVEEEHHEEDADED